MLKSHKQFHSVNGKRQILIAEDEMINREILGEILKTEYEVIYACDGIETMEKIRQNRETLSLVLLDILMPGMTGLEVLRELMKDPELSRIPVIVMTAEKDAEVESLKLGATDFIPKPYPPIDVIHARVLRTIELFEDRDIIQSTERDTLTGLYNKEYFYRYAEQLDHYHKDTAMDAIILDINHFRMVNERYGKAYGDEVLKKIASQLQERMKPLGGIVCRREADTFMVYCPHIEDYDGFLNTLTNSLMEDDSSENRIRIRMGVYPDVDKTLSTEIRFDYAKMAADTVKDSFTKTIGIYDDDLHERQLYAEQLIEDFPVAIREKQFKVYYQPKFDVRPDIPVLASAEALVRWVHPKLGMINPGVFIPLFEENGMIEQLDTYVWNEAARQIREWKDKLHCSIPISVNVSRIDLYNPRIPEILQEIIQENDLTTRDILLEITESAYTQDSSQIIMMVDAIRQAGFKIEMDDFGTGYSSLNMISSLPIDVLKLDMQFIRSAFKEGGNTYMLEVIIGIADYLSVPVIAEGVETEEQLHALKSLGCDIVQGYFFSRPAPAEEFEPFILQKKEAEIALEEVFLKRVAEKNKEKDERIREIKRGYLAEQDDSEDNPDEALEESLFTQDPAHKSVSMKTASILFVVLAIAAAVALFISSINVTSGYKHMVEASDQYIEAQSAATNMETGSDYLTDCVRCFVVSGDIEYLDAFTQEVEVTKTRNKAVADLEELLQDSNSGAIDSLNTALETSNKLVDRENHAMRLMLETGNYDMSEVPDAVANMELTKEEKAMSRNELKESAQDLVFDNYYKEQKNIIRNSVNKCTQELMSSSKKELEQASDRLAFLVRLQTVLTLVFFLIVLGVILFVSYQVRRPLTGLVKSMQTQEMIPPEGVEELRFVTRTYNTILRDNRNVREKLSHEASHDALTGLLNRGAYDLLMEDTDRQHMALIILDVDHFKIINDTYGHAVGDRILKKVADLMRTSFRSVDILCRIGGDEFVVVMTRVNSSMSQLVQNKINHINELLKNPKDELPPVSLSVGVAFSDRKNPQGDIFRDADAALYQVKEAGRAGCIIYGDETEGEINGQQSE